ncbi:MAG: TIGR00270 family protein [Candidatus Aenigmarchaeota archaeon]|nr:TIGR00270 family protein [Candidatus Aenigmarchaeota archaeon]
MSPAKIEGAVIDVCERCSKFGTKVSGPQLAYTPIKKTIKISELANLDLILIPEYGRLISKVRESKGLTRYDFAKRINEKESVVKRLEDQEFEPNEEMVKRIEDSLDIRLRERYEGVVLRQSEKKRVDLTAGDIVEAS